MKGDIRDFIGKVDQGRTDAARRIVSGTLKACGGVNLPGAPPASRDSAGDGAQNTQRRDGQTRARGGGRRKGGGANRIGSALGRATASLAGFGAAIAASGFNGALEQVGLNALRGKPAAEIVASIAEHIAGLGDLQAELLSASLRDAIYEAASLADDRDALTLGESLESYIGKEGAEGLVELFLVDYVCRRVWSILQQYVEAKTGGGEPQAELLTAVRGACVLHVRDAMDGEREAGTFAQQAWFGEDGIRHADRIVVELEARLSQSVPKVEK